MNKLYLLVLLIALCISTVMGQDVITHKTGELIKCKVIRINSKDVTFIENTRIDTLSLFRDEITKIQYQNGIIVYLTDNENSKFSSEYGEDSLYIKGKTDARIYYRNYRVAATGTLICSFFIPLGLIPAIACSSTPPSVDNLGFVDQNLIKNQSYYNGYSNEAHKIKKNKVWKNFAIGTGAYVGIVLISILGVASIL